MTLFPPCYESQDSLKGKDMPDYRLTFNGDMVGRLNVTDAFAQALAGTILSGGRIELSAAFEKTDNSPRLVEFGLSPIPPDYRDDSDPRLSRA
jgi:hypothetical protein